jgi:hypothetical protein
MTTYNTGNPLGSTSVKDLYDNAENFDDAMNSDGPAFFDRSGKRRETWQGMQNLVNDFLSAMGFEATHLQYVDGTPLTVLRPTQLIDRAPSVYKVKAPATFPVNLTGNWATDQLLLVDVGDSSLRSSLAGTNGASLVGNGIVGVDTFAAMRTILKTAPGRKAMIQGLQYDLDLADTTSTESLPNIVVATDGGRWKLNSVLPTDVMQFGADPTKVFDSTAAFQAAFTKGGTHTVRDGVYKLTSTVTADYSGLTFPEVAFPSTRLRLEGNSTANTIFEITPVGANDVGLKLIGTDPAAVGQGIHSQDKYSGFTVYPALRNNLGVGLYALNKAYMCLEDYATESLNIGLLLDGVLSSKFHNITVKNGVTGMQVGPTAYTLPNANTFVGFLAGGNSLAGVSGTIGATNTFIGGSIESNGTMGNPASAGMYFNLNGSNGTACLTLDSVYFEGNGGPADLVLDNISSVPVTVVLKGCTFNRVSNVKFTTANITALSSGGGLLKVILVGCSFYSAGTYVPLNTRPFISYGANVEIVGWDTCTHNENTSIPTSFYSTSSAVISGNVNGAGTILSGTLSGVSVTRVGAGVYDVIKAGGWAPTVDGYSAFAVPNTAGFKLDICTRTNASTFRLSFRTSDATPFADCPFSFQVLRTQ